MSPTTESTWGLLPEWLVCERPAGDDGRTWLFHTRPPRFLVLLVVDPILLEYVQTGPDEPPEVVMETPSGYYVGDWVWLDGPLPSPADLEPWALAADEVMALDDAHAETFTGGDDGDDS